MFMRFIGDGVGHQRDGGACGPTPEADTPSGVSDEEDDPEVQVAPGAGADSEDEQIDYGYVASEDDDGDGDGDNEGGGQPIDMPGSWEPDSGDERSPSEDGNDDDAMLLNAGGFNEY